MKQLLNESSEKWVQELVTWIWPVGLKVWPCKPSAAMMRNNHAGALLQKLNTHGGNHSRSSAFSALHQGLSGGLGPPEFALLS